MDIFGISTFWILSHVLVGVATSKVHKVHNLILYPDKHEWCEARQIEMVITYPGCTPKGFSNRVCVGQCFSYTSPRTKPPNRVEDKLNYCDFCAPSNATWEKIVLECDTDRYTSFEKEVELIHECACTACHPELQALGETPGDNYIYEYDSDDPYDDYDSDDATKPPVADIAQIAQQSLQSEDIAKLERNDRRFIEFNVNPAIMDQASRVRAEQQKPQHQEQKQHQQDSPSRPRDAPSRPRDAASRPTDSPSHPRDSPSHPSDSPSHHRDAPSHHRDAASHHRHYNNHDPQSRQWILNSDVQLHN